MQEKPIKFIRITNWPDHNAVDAKKLINTIADIYKDINNKNIAIHCKAGMGRTSSFFTAKMILEQKLKPSENKENLTATDIMLHLKKARNEEQVLKNDAQRAMLYQIADILAVPRGELLTK